jgi:galactofuranose transport system substrate-binding protein
MLRKPVRVLASLPAPPNTMLIPAMKYVPRRTFLRVSTCLALSGLSLGLGSCSRDPAAGGAAASGKKALRVGFAQTGAESDWRTANSESMISEAAKRGIDLKFSDGQGKQENQIRAVRSFITQGVDAIVLAPIVETGWEPVLQEAKRAKIPVVLMDRTVQTSDDSLYTCFIGSDFYEEGRMAADWLAKHVNGKGNIVELQGTPGSAPANERRKAFADAIAKYPDLKVIDSQSGNFELSGGKQVMEAFLKKHGKAINIVYAHNDFMALGAIQAIEAAGLKPGKDIVMVSIDAMRPAVQAVVDGKLNCTVECNPLFGPVVFDTIEKIVAGQTVPKKTINKDELIDATNAPKLLPTRKY